MATIDDDWHTDGDRSLSELWIGVTRFKLLNKNPPEGHRGFKRLTKKQATTRPGRIWPAEWSRTSKHFQRMALKKRAEEKPKLDAVREQRGIYFVPDDDLDCRNPRNCGLE